VFKSAAVEATGSDSEAADVQLLLLVVDDGRGGGGVSDDDNCSLMMTDRGSVNEGANDVIVRHFVQRFAAAPSRPQQPVKICLILLMKLTIE